VQALEAAGVADGWHAISVNPRATQYAALAMIPCAAIFFLVRALDRRQLRRLVFVFAAVAACEALLGILQLGAAPRSLLYLGNPHGGGAATGTYVNRNHFAALMAMALPVLMAMWAVEILPHVTSGGRVLRDHPRNADVRLARRVGLSLLVVTVALALLFTRSRAGIGAGLAALALASFGLVWGAASIQVRALFVLVALMALGLAAYIGLTPVLERFAPDDLSLGYAGRMSIAAGSVRAGLDFLPLGSGLGTFADVYRRYQLESFAGFIDHAHNDYAEAFVELGVMGVAAMALLLAAYARRWRDLGRARLSRNFGYLQAGAGLGMAAMLAHAAFDFNFHIPANALYFSFLAGVFFFTPPADHAAAAA
jgi:O-antigen ligase